MTSSVELPFISVIIPTKNAEACIRDCLESLKALDYPADRFEVIIADGNSTDRTREIAESFGAVVLDDRGNKPSDGRLLGFERSTGELIAFCDSDCVADSAWLRNAVKYFDDPTVGGVSGPTLVPPNETPFGRGAGYVFSLAVAADASVHADRVPRITEVRDLPGANCIYQRAAIGPALPLAAEVAVSEDVIANWQIRQNGWRLLHVPDVRLWHHKRPTPKRLWHQMYRYGWGRVQIARVSRDMLWPAHVVIAAWMPLAAIVLPLLAIFAPWVLLAFAAGGGLGLIGLFLAAWLKMKSFLSAFSTLIAFLILIVSWPFGFLRELLFPDPHFTEFLRRRAGSE